jgi:hypothetical protein
VPAIALKMLLSREPQFILNGLGGAWEESFLNAPGFSREGIVEGVVSVDVAVSLL